MLPPIRPALDPLAQRAAINALEAQREAYRQYARTVEDQTRAVGGGDAGQATAAAASAQQGFDDLDAGAQALRPHLDRVRAQGTPDQQADVQRRLATLSSDADRAQTAVQNLTAQLDAWRLAYGRQLASVGLAPGGSGGGNGDRASSASVSPTAGASESSRGAVRAHDAGSYGPRGRAQTARSTPRLINRLG